MHGFTGLGGSVVNNLDVQIGFRAVPIRLGPLRFKV